MIHTSRFQEDKPAKEHDVARLLQVCKLVGGITRVVLTCGMEKISGTKQLHFVWLIGSDSIFKLTFTVQENDDICILGHFVTFWSVNGFSFSI